MHVLGLSAPGLKAMRSAHFLPARLGGVRVTSRYFPPGRLINFQILSRTFQTLLNAVTCGLDHLLWNGAVWQRFSGQQC